MTIKVQAEDMAGTAVIMFTGLGMTVIMVEELAQAVFVFGAVLCVVVIDVAIDDFDILAVVDDFEGSPLPRCPVGARREQGRCPGTDRHRRFSVLSEFF